jgi:hypothetical protein
MATIEFTRFAGKLNPSVYAIAGSAEELLLNPRLSERWSFWGCPDGDWFFAAAPDVRPQDLRRLKYDGDLLVPPGADVVLMTREELAEFVP